MSEKIEEIVVTAFIKELLSESKEIFNDLKDESKQLLNIELLKYIKKQTHKYSYVKTFLRGSSLVYINDIYYNLELLDEGNRIINTDNLFNHSLKSNYISIIGDAGSGKSTLFKHLFLSTISRKFGIPILVELRDLNETDGNIEEFITNKIFENRLSQNDKIMERLLKKGKFVFFLDGFDELRSSVSNVIVKNMNSFISKYNENKYLLTSRPFSNIENLPSFVNFRIKKLEGDEIYSFIKIQLKYEIELSDKIIQSLKKNSSEFIKDFLTNPLLLTIYILTFQNNAEIPNKKYIFYRRVINSLFSEHDSKSKIGFVREKLSKLSQEQFEDILKAFSYISFFEEKFEFDFDYIIKTLKNIRSKKENIFFENENFIQDLKSAVALWTEDNGVYAFIHRSIQEYFAALFIKDLNSESNIKAYEKIQNKFNDPFHNEYKNFLSFCEEMDEINFKKHFQLPLLQELTQMIDKTNEKSVVKSVVRLLSTAILVNNIHNTFVENDRVIINPIIYKAKHCGLRFVYQMLKLLNTFAFTLDNILKEERNPQLSQRYDARDYMYIKFKDEKDDKIFDLIYKSEFKQLAIDFNNYLVEEIEIIENSIEKARKSDNDLLELV